MDFLSEIKEKALHARVAFSVLSQAPTTQKNLALNEISKALLDQVEEINQAIQKDLSYLSEEEKQWITLEGLDLIIKDLFQIMEMPDPVGDVFDGVELPDGLKLTKFRIPLGTLGLVLDVHPQTIVNTAALAIKSSNALIVWSGKRMENTSRLLVKIVQMGLEAADLPIQIVQLIRDPSESCLEAFLRYKEGLDVILLKATPPLTQFCLEKSSVPLIYEKERVSHIYVDQNVNFDKALDVIRDAKKAYDSSSFSTLLVHEAIVGEFLPLLFKFLEGDRLSYRLDSKCWNLFVSQFSDAGDSQLAETSDWSQSCYSHILNIKIVNDMEDALEHIRQYGTGYCEGILSDHPIQAMIFASVVDAAGVMINASTAIFAGIPMGLGPQALISTQKLQAAGPVGLKELMSYKWLIQGNYTSIYPITVTHRGNDISF